MSRSKFPKLKYISNKKLNNRFDEIKTFYQNSEFYKDLKLENISDMATYDRMIIREYLKRSCLNISK